MVVGLPLQTGKTVATWAHLGLSTLPGVGANTSLVPSLQSHSGHKRSSGRGWQWIYRNVRNMVHMEQSSCELPRLPARCGSDTS